MNHQRAVSGGGEGQALLQLGIAAVSASKRFHVMSLEGGGESQALLELGVAAVLLQEHLEAGGHLQCAVRSEE